MLSESKRVKIAQRVAQELNEGDVINLGIGIPTMIPNYIGNKTVFLQSENGLLGMGPTPVEEDIDMDLISASKSPVSAEIGASIFDSADSFAMIRGNHVDLAVLGTLQIDEKGQIANWSIPGANILGVGGAMDLLVGARRVVVATTHLTNDNKPKLLQQLTFPSSGDRTVDMVVTEHAVFKFEDGKMQLTELLSEITLDELAEITEANYEILL